MPQVDRLLTFHTDPGHGWLETTIQELMKYGIHNKVSKYSYRDGDRVFLEEDCDAGLLLRAYQEHGVVYGTMDKHVDYDHPIRRKPRFTVFI